MFRVRRLHDFQHLEHGRKSFSLFLCTPFFFRRWFSFIWNNGTIWWKQMNCIRNVCRVAWITKALVYIWSPINLAPIARIHARNSRWNTKNKNQCRDTDKKLSQIKKCFAVWFVLFGSGVFLLWFVIIIFVFVSCQFGSCSPRGWLARRTAEDKGSRNKAKHRRCAPEWVREREREHTKEFFTNINGFQ